MEGELNVVCESSRERKKGRGTVTFLKLRGRVILVESRGTRNSATPLRTLVTHHMFRVFVQFQALHFGPLVARFRFVTISEITRQGGNG